MHQQGIKRDEMIANSIPFHPIVPQYQVPVVAVSEAAQRTGDRESRSGRKIKESEKMKEERTRET